MNWTEIAIVPFGPVYFGDGRPMAAGETDVGKGRFPPSPRTVQGIVRTTLLRSVAGLSLVAGAEQRRIQELVGTPDQMPDGWQIAGPWLARWAEETGCGAVAVEPWLPLPRYLMPPFDKVATSLTCVRPRDLGGPAGSRTTPPRRPPLFRSRDARGGRRGSPGVGPLAGGAA